MAKSVVLKNCTVFVLLSMCPSDVHIPWYVLNIVKWFDVGCLFTCV